MSTFSRLNEKNPVLVCIITWMLRILIGGLFVFSGFTKGIDVWGTIYKLNEYFSVWNYEVWDVLILAGSFGICVVEFLIGVFFIFGCFRKATPVLALLIMAFMLPLTFWLAVKNPISDCGCFGDAFKLSNWDTFFKNIIITLGTLWLLLFNKKAICLVNPLLQWIGVLSSALYILIIVWLGYYYQPLLDFRPYKVGTLLIEHPESLENDDYQSDDMVFVYEKDGVNHEFSIDDELPDEDDGWIFIERRYGHESNPEAQISQPDWQNKSDKNIRFYSEDGLEDLTDEVIGNGRQLILMIPKLSEITAAKTWKINSLYDWSGKNDVELIAAVGGNPLEIAEWKDISLAEYPIYTSDDTSIEEVVRSNPGIVYLEDGIIKWKSSLRALDIDDFMKEDIATDPMSFARDNTGLLLRLTWIYLAIMAFLIFLSFSPKLISKLSNIHWTKAHEKNAGGMGKS